MQRDALTDCDLFREAALIGGEWLDAAGRDSVAVMDLATSDIIGQVPALSASDAAVVHRSL